LAVLASVKAWSAFEYWSLALTRLSSASETAFEALLNLVWASSTAFLAVAKAVAELVCSVNANCKFCWAALRAAWALVKRFLAFSKSEVACLKAASAALNDAWALLSLTVATAVFCCVSATIFFLVSTLSRALKRSLSAATCSASMVSKVDWTEVVFDFLVTSTIWVVVSEAFGWTLIVMKAWPDFPYLSAHSTWRL